MDIKAKSKELAKAGAIRAAKGSGKLAMSALMGTAKGAKLGWQLGKKHAETKAVKNLNVGDHIEEGQVIGNQASMNKGDNELTLSTDSGITHLVMKGNKRIKVLTPGLVAKLAVEYDADSE